MGWFSVLQGLAFSARMCLRLNFFHRQCHYQHRVQGQQMILYYILVLVVMVVVVVVVVVVVASVASSGRSNSKTITLKYYDIVILRYHILISQSYDFIVAY